MPPTATMPLNGKPRKQLSDQLDRLDEIIDVLGDGLNDAVVSAMRNGARQAVKEALVEVLTHPEFLSVLHSAGVAPPTLSKPTIWTRLKAGVGKLLSAAGTFASWVRDRFRKAVAATSEQVRSVRDQGKAVLTLARSGGIYLRQLTLTATIVGILSGLVAIVTPHELLAVAGAIGSAVIAAIAHVAYRARRFLQSLIPMAMPAATPA
jgi:hypothetical protein